MGSLRIARILGIDIFIHWSWFAILVLLIWSLADGFYKQVGGNDWSVASRWVAAVITSLAFFLSVLLHELSHSVVARRLGLPVASITLFIFGGVSSLTEEPASARDEFKVAIAGPATSFLIAVVLGIAFLGFFLADQEASVPGAICGYLSFINLAVGLFNMLPGYPLDGGRVLRAGLWARSRNMLKATRWAATTGTIISFVLIAVGVLTVLAGGFIGGIWFIVIGWFLRNTSEQAYQSVLLKNTLEGAKVGELVNRRFVTAPPDMSLAQIVNEHILGQGQRCVPIVVADDLLGLLTMTDLRKVAPELWASTSAFRAMTPRERLQVVDPDDELIHALQIMAANEVDQVPVIDRERTFLGLVTRADLLQLIHLRTELGMARSEPPAEVHARQ
ncbi:MAG TPA: site-2 protease family protein [Dehalococcoidia bacterium]|jgi:Zn-dependent protease|nr:site-2 protease family protein [Dehalococcoidia bacterium]